MRLGIDVLMDSRLEFLKGRRIGVLAHAASLNAEGLHAVDRIARGGGKMAALFGPEHGLLTMAQDMEAVSSAVDPSSGIQIHSLYGATLDSLKPTAAMLEGIDVLVVDLQDVGSRYYTYVWTASLCAEACAEAGKQVVVCDRPNPIGGTRVEGGGIEEDFESFVGLHSLPVRHGMTIGEIVQLMNNRAGIGANLTVVPMEGWRRDMSWTDTGIPWTNPSPNMCSYTAALLYPGMCLIEGTNISEGRGTDTPFEIVGAPYIDSEEIIEAFGALKLPGVRVAPSSFIPTRQKWKSLICNGVRWIISDVGAFEPYLTGLAFLWLVNKLYKGRGFEWRHEPYEFVTNRPAIDLLTGSSKFREGIDALSLDDLKSMCKTPANLLSERKVHLLYK
ncbi:MAG: DUF1343 domain-containing protein [Pseudomonadota bacterium]